MAETSLEATPVVTAFLYRRGKVLLLRRSERVATHRGRWSGVSGYLERHPLAQARLELSEEVGVSAEDAALRGIGVPMVVDDPEVGRPWLVFTFLFRLRDGARVETDWESAATTWVWPDDVSGLDTVPGLAQGLDRVWPPWGSARFWSEMELNASDVVRGATELALQGLRAVQRLRGAARLRGLRAFSALHPSMGVFPHLAARAVSEGISLGKLSQELEAATRASAERAASSLRMCRWVLTHSASRACLETLVRWWRAGREVVVTESRPKREGVAMARHLAQQGMRVRLISDAGMGWCVAQCDAVLVGADAIGGDGVLVNKTGTRLAVLAARDAGIPAYAVAQTHKICPAGWPLALMPQEPADLVRASGPRVANVVFDATPLHLFTEVFTEGGRLTRALLGGVQQRLTTDVLIP